MSKRIVGIDLARALAVFGMVLVNFKLVFSAERAAEIPTWMNILDGKAAATFVVLAGLGVGLTLQPKPGKAVQQAANTIFRRSLFLFLFGFVYLAIWPADILHYYGLYLPIVVLANRLATKFLLPLALVIIGLYPILFLFFDYAAGWDFDTLTYVDFWTPAGFFRNLFFNGFHPVLPWVSFAITGLWLSRKDLRDTKVLTRIGSLSLVLFLGIQLTSTLLLQATAGAPEIPEDELLAIFGTAPMPPLPLYMLAGSTIAVTVICSCILFAQQFATPLLRLLADTGKLALTFYVAHAVLGMGLVGIFWPEGLGQASWGFSLVYAVVFCLLCVGFTAWWRKRYRVGPLEWLMRRVGDL